MNLNSAAMRKSTILSVCVVIVVAVTLGAVTRSKTNGAPTRTADTVLAAAVPAPAVPVESNPERNAYFGQTHLHTSWSLDAYILGNTVTGPAEAYQFAIGQPIKHPAGYEVQIRQPLDFQGVTDHAEYVGMVRMANDPSSPVSKLPIAVKLRVSASNSAMMIFQWLAGSIAKNEPIKELLNPELTGSVWKQNIQIADQYNKPGKFTAFVSYEWTSMPNSQNLHRNVFFRDSVHVPAAPFSAIDSDHPEDLWAWMDAQRKAGNELLCISHNANLSNGLMFPVDVDSKGRPLDAAWANERLNNEPLTEIKQCKGTSETTPELSPNDEFADYELMSYLIGIDNSTSKPHGSYAREAYKNGLAMQDTRGYNPYKFGFVGAGDAHNTATAYSHSNFFGDHALVDPTPEIRLSGKVASGMDIIKTGPSGLGGVWAESNTRAAIFDAMKRKETFGTTGVRMRVRMFGGWDYPDDTVEKKDWVKTAYAQGVPMGGDLPAKKGTAPAFIVWAVKDPDDGNLDRIQIVKGWSQNGQTFEKVYDVVWSGDRKPDPTTGKVPAVGNTVDVKNASYTNTIGATELRKVWRDPDFDPKLNAFYYARVLQIPTPRWSTYDAKKLGVAPPTTVPASLQERAWTSPIWYTPSSEASANAQAEKTVSNLLKKGAQPLDDAQLKALVIGKSISLRNNVTGEQFRVRYGRNGRYLAEPTPRKSAEQTSEFGDWMRSAQQEQAPGYSIQNGKIVNMVGDATFQLAVYKQGDKYIAARGSEFGYANYQIIAPVNDQVAHRKGAPQTMSNNHAE
jgi:hypothetical protein